MLTKPIKLQKPTKKSHRENGETRCILKSRSGCKNSKENLVDDEIPEHGDSHASSSHGLSIEPTRSASLCKHTVFILISLKTIIARSVRGSNYKGAEDAMAKLYFEPRHHVPRDW